MSDNVFHVYEHYTLDTSELFYVGYGKNKRAYDVTQRNRFWKHIYSKHGVRVVLVKENVSLNEAIDTEIALIKKYGRRDKNTGPLVNLTDGGEGLKNASDETRKKLSLIASNISEETRRKMSESAKNRPPMKEETREKLRIQFSGKNNPNYGRNFSDEHRKRLSESHKGYVMSEETKRKLSEISRNYRHTAEDKLRMSELAKKHPVSQYSLDGVYIKTYPSIKEASLATGAKNIAAVARARRNHSAGYIWKYEETEK
jgi:hypothetical protein